MSEFKFACPVCGQHITADSTASGTQLECPTCFRKIIVPQAPTTADPKFILSASQANKPRPTTLETVSDAVPKRGGLPDALPALALLVVLVGAGVGGWLLFGDKIRARLHPPVAAGPATNPAARPKPPPPPRLVRAIPTNTFWTLQLTNAVLPDGIAAGSLRGSGFLCDRATLQGGNLSLRQPHSGLLDLGVTIQLPVWQGEQWSGKTIELTPEQPPPVPRVTLQWRNEQDKTSRQNITNGYALKLSFGQAVGGQIPGKLYLALPDPAKSFVAGNFDAEIKRPPAPKPPRGAKPGG